MKSDTLSFILKGIESNKARQLLTKVYASLEESGIDLSIASNIKNIGTQYQSLGLDLKIDLKDVSLNPTITLVERVSAMAYINQKLTLLSHLSARLCTVRDYNSTLKELNSNFSTVVWKDI